MPGFWSVTFLRIKDLSVRWLGHPGSLAPPFTALERWAAQPGQRCGSVERGSSSGRSRSVARPGARTTRRNRMPSVTLASQRTEPRPAVVRLALVDEGAEARDPVCRPGRNAIQERARPHEPVHLTARVAAGCGNGRGCPLRPGCGVPPATGAGGGERRRRSSMLRRPLLNVDASPRWPSSRRPRSP